MQATTYPKPTSNLHLPLSGRRFLGNRCLISRRKLRATEVGNFMVLATWCEGGRYRICVDTFPWLLGYSFQGKSKIRGRSKQASQTSRIWAWLLFLGSKGDTKVNDSWCYRLNVSLLTFSCWNPNLRGDGSEGRRLLAGDELMRWGHCKRC